MSIDSSAPSDAPKKPGIVKRVLGAIVGLLVVAGAFYAFNYFNSDAAQAKAGDCVSVTGTATKPEFATVACDAPEANYTVGKTLSSTSESCGDNYDEYTETARRGPDSKVCLLPNLVEGQCHDFQSSGMGYPKVDCSTSGAIKVTKVVKESDADCGEANPLSYPEPKITFCLAEASA